MNLALLLAGLLSIQWILLFGIIQCCAYVNDWLSLAYVPTETPARRTTTIPSHQWAPRLLARGRFAKLDPNDFFVDSFSPCRKPRPRRQAPKYASSLMDRTKHGDEKMYYEARSEITPPSNTDDAKAQSADIDISSFNRAQILLACRAYLLRKHKLEWKQKKRRAEAASSPLFNEGYFWPDPNDLLYLREDPDPCNLIYNETYGEYYGYKRNGVRLLTSQDTTYSGKNYLIGESVQLEDERPSTSSNPFSTNPLYPSDAHVRRTISKMKLWNNQTWKEEWYKRRWAGKVTAPCQKNQDKQEKLIRNIPNDVLESSSFDDMSEEEVTEAIVTYINANLRKSESRKNLKYKRQAERESFREWRNQVKREARASKMSEHNIKMKRKDVAPKLAPPSNKDVLSFSPSAARMKKLRAQRSEKSRQAFQTRLRNSKAKVLSSSSQKITKLRRSYNRDSDYGGSYDNSVKDEQEDEISPMQAILHIDMALDHDKLPSPVDVEIILKPARLGRRKTLLRRILSECFDLRGKCVPAFPGDSELLFVTKCTINELGCFVLSKLREVQAK